MQDGPAERPGLGSGAQQAGALPLPFPPPLRWVSPGTLPAGKGGFAPFLPLHLQGQCVLAGLRSTSLGGVGQLAGNLFPNPREVELVGTRKESDLGDWRTEVGGPGRWWGVGSRGLKSGLWRPRSGARGIGLPCFLWCLSLPTPFLRSTCLRGLGWGCGFVCRIKPICVHSGGGVVTAPGRDSILTTRPSHLPPRGAQI